MQVKFISIAIEILISQSNEKGILKLIRSLGHGTNIGSKFVVGLDVVFQATHHHVVVEASRPNFPKKVPGADVSIFVAIGVVPCIKVGISYCFSKLMGNHTDSRINSSIAIG